MMFSNVYAFVFFFCGLFAFGCGLDDDFTEMKHMIGKLVEENTILRREVGSIREDDVILRSEFESLRGQCGEENAILKREVENIKGQCGEMRDDVRHEMTQMRDDVDALNFRLEGVQGGNYTFEQKIYQVLGNHILFLI